MKAPLARPVALTYGPRNPASDQPGDRELPVNSYSKRSAK
jgi:hypothetical protein